MRFKWRHEEVPHPSQCEAGEGFGEFADDDLTFADIVDWFGVAGL